MRMIYWRQLGHIVLLAGVLGMIGLMLNSTANVRAYSPTPAAYTTTESAAGLAATHRYQSQVATVSYPAHTSRIPYTAEDLDLLARLVSSEAQGEPYLGQVATAAVTINRILDQRFPDTLAGVVYQIEGDRYQYEPVMNGSINHPATETAYQAAREALDGHDPTNGAIGFYNPDKVRPGNWVWQWPIVARIGNHVFFTY